LKIPIHDDNRGLTLIELIIGITILAIVVVPLLNVFIAGANASLKSRKYSTATEAAQNVIEQVQSCKTEAFLSDADEIYSGAHYYTASTDGSGRTSYSLYGTAAPSSADKKFYIGINNVSFDAASYDALITLDAGSSKNKTPVSISNNMDALIGMTGADGTALSILQTQYASDLVDPASLTLDDMNRRITMDVTKDITNSFYDIDVNFEYSGKAASNAAGFDYAAKSSSRISVADAIPDGKPIFSVYLLFCAYYSGTDTITINNLAGGDFNVFLVDTTAKPTVPATYTASIQYKTQYDNSVPRVFTNFIVNNDSNNRYYYAFNHSSPAFYVKQQLSGYLVESDTLNREFSVNVSLFKSGSNFSGEPIVSIDSNKLD